jgi:hypothetical protein
MRPERPWRIGLCRSPDAPQYMIHLAGPLLEFTDSLFQVVVPARLDVSKRASGDGGARVGE